MWRSKLGNAYPKEEIDRNDKQFQDKLTKLRRLQHNRRCADCDVEGTVWAIVNIGTFVCMRCASLHRALGTHVSKPKGCTGTYLWGPDELNMMESVGNARAQAIFGGGSSRPSTSASDDDWKRFLSDRYEHRLWYKETASAVSMACGAAPNKLDTVTSVSHNTIASVPAYLATSGKPTQATPTRCALESPNTLVGTANLKAPAQEPPDLISFDEPDSRPAREVVEFFSQFGLSSN